MHVKNHYVLFNYYAHSWVRYMIYMANQVLVYVTVVYKESLSLIQVRGSGKIYGGGWFFSTIKYLTSTTACSEAHIIICCNCTTNTLIQQGAEEQDKKVWTLI